MGTVRREVLRWLRFHFDLRNVFIRRHLVVVGTGVGCLGERDPVEHYPLHHRVWNLFFCFRVCGVGLSQHDPRDHGDVVVLERLFLGRYVVRISGHETTEHAHRKNCGI